MKKVAIIGGGYVGLVSGIDDFIRMHKNYNL